MVSFGAGTVQMEALDLAALSHAGHAVLRARLVVERMVSLACVQGRGSTGTGSPEWTPAGGTAMTPSAKASPRIMPGPVCEAGKASPSMNLQGIRRVRPGHGSTSAAEVTCPTALRGRP